MQTSTRSADLRSAPVRVASKDQLDAVRAEYLAQRVSYWNEYAATINRWERNRRYYRSRLSEIYQVLVPPGMRVLELGCGPGDLLASLQPSYGVGVDSSANMLGLARQRHPGLNFIEQDAHSLDLGEQFDFIICSDLVNDLWDVQQVFEAARRHSLPSTRLIVNAYSRLWEGPRHAAESAGIAKRQLVQNWLTAEDITNLLYLADFELIRHSQEILWPFRTPLIDTICNRVLVKVAPFRWFALTNILVARPQPMPHPGPEPIVTVVVPARNEAGNISHILDRVPEMGGGTELIFVEGNSKDDTYEVIEREIASRPGCGATLYRQAGKGKGDAVRLGYSKASGEVLMILDADLTVPPEDLPRFYEAWRSGRGEFINGVRLVYPMEQRAMRFFNLLGNKFFSLAFSWLLGQSIKDTLCGTKVLSRRDYEMIAANRAYFGHLDPFGDFDLIFGAAKYTLKIVDLPIRYRERTYGDTNIQRWSHGWLLLKMLGLAMRRLKFV
jgi:SAM-dependent methyltransferase